MQDNNHPIVYYITRYPFFEVVKIGTTNNLPRRLTQLARKYGDELHVMGVEYDNTESGPSLEAHRHTQFMKSRIIGEWFWATDDLRAHINSLDENTHAEVNP